MPSILAYSDGGFLLPRAASTYAGEVDWLFYFILAVSVFFFVLIGVLMVGFAIKYRQTDKNVVATGATHSTALEVTWTAIPIVIVLAIFYWGFKGFMNIVTPPSNAISITVTAYQWGWNFTYPNGAKDDQLYLPAGRPVQLVLESRDVIHSLSIPAFRAKKDVVPGRYNKMWVQSDWAPSQARVETVSAKAKGGKAENTRSAPRITYDIFCSQYCGNNHSKMGPPKYHVYVYQYDDWVNKLDNLKVLDPPIQTGKKVYQSYCASCHLVNGQPMTGPTWKDLYGHTVTLSDGSTVEADDNYIRESILYPNRKIVAGFQPAMSSFKGTLSDQQIRGVIEYMKSISKNYNGKLMKGWGKSEEDAQGEGDAGGGGNENGQPQGQSQGQDQGDAGPATEPVALAKPMK